MEEIRIKELGEIFTGKTPPTANPNNFGNDYPFVTPADFTEDKFIYKTERGLSKVGIKYSTLIPVNAICVTCIGSTIGKLGITIKESSTNQQINTIVANDNYNVDYIYYLLLYNVPYFKELAGVNAVPQLNKSDFSKVRLIATRNKPEQTAIATILSKVDEAIEATQKSIKAAEKLKKALMQNLLKGKLKPDGTWRTEHEFYEDEKFGKVPVGWEVDRFKNRIKVQYGKSQKDIVSENGTIPIYGTGGIIEYGTAALCESESILIGRKGTIDKPYYIDVPFWAVDTTYYVESFENGNMKFLFYLLQRLNLKSLNEATGVPSLTRRTLNRQLMLFPTLTEQNEITAQIDKYDNVIESKQTKIKSLQRLKKSLMQNLLTGKVRLPEKFIKQFEVDIEIKEEIV